MYLFVGHELEGRLGRDLDYVDAIPPPERPDAALLDHLGQAAHDAHVPAPSAVDLRDRREEGWPFSQHAGQYFKPIVNSGNTSAVASRHQ